MSSDTQASTPTNDAPTSPPADRRGSLLAMIDQRAAGMSETRARERIASLVVLSILQIAVSFLVLSHAPNGADALAGIGFVLALCLAFNGALVFVCRRRITSRLFAVPS